MGKKKPFILSLFRLPAGGRFIVEEKSGAVVTQGTDSFLLDMEYVLYVRVEDRGDFREKDRYQSSPEYRLSIVGGQRPPQFYLSEYHASVPENSAKGHKYAPKTQIFLFKWVHVWWYLYCGPQDQRKCM